MLHISATFSLLAVRTEHDPMEYIRDSEWFTRDWVLQELLSPLYLVFCDKHWNRIPLDKGSEQGSTLIGRVTGIPGDCLRGWGPMEMPCYCIADKMSCAANRKTTRTEDGGYCPLGLFNIHMPLLYGEGSHAFLRPQQEVILKHEDETVFAWLHAKPGADQLLYRNMPNPAPHPSCFLYESRESVVPASLERR